MMKKHNFVNIKNINLIAIDCIYRSFLYKAVLQCRIYKKNL